MSPPTPAPTARPLARRMWRTLEPYHGVVYFAPEPDAQYERLGAKGRTGYFASRSAPMGAVPPAVVSATFFNFSPALVAHAMDGAWDLAAPAAWSAARLAGIDATLQRLLGDAVTSREMSEAAALARQAADAVRPHLSGRALAAGHASQPWPDSDHLVVWHAISVLREFRGDGHVALLAGSGLSGIEALIVHAATGDVPASILQATRGWTDNEWAAGIASLAARGVVDAAGAFTPAGAAERELVETRTDALAALPWDAIGEEAGERLRALVRPWSRLIVEGGDLGRFRPEQ